MRNALLLALVAAVLFAVSAGLSLWLNQPKPTEDNAGKAVAKKGGPADVSGDRDTSVPKAVVQPVPTGDVSEPLRLANQLQGDLSRIAKREEELDYQQQVYRFALDDIRNEMETLQKLMQQLPPPKNATAKANDTAAPPATPVSIPTDNNKKKLETPDPATNNLRTAIGISESMAPDKIAKILEQMARSGKADDVVQVLAKMSPRQSARILSLISDEKLSEQLFEKLMASKKQSGSSPPP
jgi:flagellar motility protein MotE (MotC chaperone)